MRSVDASPVVRHRTAGDGPTGLIPYFERINEKAQVQGFFGLGMRVRLAAELMPSF